MSAGPREVGGRTRFVLVGGLMSYRALFNWATPPMFISTLVAAPLTQLLFFSLLGRTLGVADAKFYVIGNAIFAVAYAGLFGGTMAIGNERRFGTLSSILLSPRSRGAIFLSRALPYIVNGVLVSAVVMTAGALLLGVRMPWSATPGMLLCLITAAGSCSFFGLVIGSIGLRLSDIWTVSNLANSALLLGTGVTVPQQSLPHWIRIVGSWLPVTHAAAAGRELANGGSLSAARSLLVHECLLASLYALLALVLMRWFERAAMHNATLELL